MILQSSDWTELDRVMILQSSDWAELGFLEFGLDRVLILQSYDWTQLLFYRVLTSYGRKDP